MKKHLKYLKIAGALSAIGLAIYLIWEHGALSTVGNYMRIWFAQIWEVAVRLFIQFWEAVVRLLEVVWRPLLVFVENMIRGMATRPFGKFVAWFFAGITLRYLVGPRVRDAYEKAVGYVREQGSRVGALWFKLPFSARVVTIIVGAVSVAVVNVGLLLLPLGFFVEPIYRYLRNWIARESMERTSYSKRFNNWVYRWVRWLMRESPLFRKCLWPLRYRRFKAIQQARKLHFEYRKQGEGLSDMLKDLVKREKPETEKDKSGPP